MKTILITAVSIIISLNVFSQKFLTQSGSIQFFSETPIENIEAINNQVSSVIDLENGTLAFSLLMKAFIFEKALMQEHFNEKYMQSEKFPKASFKGVIANFNDLILTEDPTKVLISGNLSIHGVSNEITAEGTLRMSTNGKHIIGDSEFQVKPEEYNIKIPSVVSDNIAEYIDIKVELEYDRMF